jgi:dTDP-4-amino-4,6-dideoxygalactose transaminase
MILTDDSQAAIQLKKMSYDGRMPDTLWAEQDIDTLGYHYYMTPETAQLGLNKLRQATETLPKRWSYEDYPDISMMKVFNVK